MMSTGAALASGRAACGGGMDSALDTHEAREDAARSRYARRAGRTASQNAVTATDRRGGDAADAAALPPPSLRSDAAPLSRRRDERRTAASAASARSAQAARRSASSLERADTLEHRAAAWARTAADVAPRTAPPTPQEGGKTAALNAAADERASSARARASATPEGCGALAHSLSRDAPVRRRRVRRSAAASTLATHRSRSGGPDSITGGAGGGGGGDEASRRGDARCPSAADADAAHAAAPASCASTSAHTRTRSAGCLRASRKEARKTESSRDKNSCHTSKRDIMMWCLGKRAPGRNASEGARDKWREHVQSGAGVRPAAHPAARR